MQGSAVVVGGGLSGIAAALCLAATGWRVALVEQAPQLAQGWRSRAAGGGFCDLGVRVPAESGIAWADALIFHRLPRVAEGRLSWNRFPGLAREGHVFRGRANLDTACLDATLLDAAALARARKELVQRRNRPDPAERTADFATRAEAIYGPTLLAEALEGACRSLLGRTPAALAWNATEGRLPARIVVAGHAETDLLRTRGRLAERLAHPSARSLKPGPLARSYLYPAHGGIGAWVAALECQLAAHAVDVRTGTRIAALHLVEDEVHGVVLSGGEQLATELVVWTIRPDALPLPGLPAIPAATCPVGARLLLLDRPVPHDLHWAVSYDPESPFMRVGFPEALAGQPAPGMTPVLLETRTGRAAPASDAALLDVLAGHRLVAPGARIAGAVALGEGYFAVETTESAAARTALNGAVRHLRGLALIGPAGGGHQLVPTLVREAAMLAADLAARASAALPAAMFA
ncbi:MAG: FAD-dependent oxidoreductase [Acetobacteraceae bacterium]|nr:FAD-dependent oxidoreductase [Acetobacteraceae bacterium]